ncbi:AbrB/MazE/SpoVT family DNA-binding domain-containing protein [Candidatus Woesearchaeota archaeon]|nr:AbrB/MazE/SpoVT family DNA-binding domain-containing protein [Candidatus Woesearchaeota archaeon]
MVKKGKCMKGQMVYGIATISEKGQIAIPVNIRRELELETGDKLMIIKRKDNTGFTFLKLSMMDKLVDKIRTDDDFFSRMEVKNGKM